MKYRTMEKSYTREDLLEVLASYDRMIDRNAKEYPTACLSDIQASIQFVLEANQYENQYKSYATPIEVK